MFHQGQQTSTQEEQMFHQGQQTSTLEEQMSQQGQQTSPVPQHPGIVSPPSTCPDGSTFCSDDVCSVATCPRVPTAVCRVSKCDKPCQAKWFMVLPPPPYPASSPSTFPDVEVTGICFGREFAWCFSYCFGF